MSNEKRKKKERGMAGVPVAWHRPTNSDDTRASGGGMTTQPLDTAASLARSRGAVSSNRVNRGSGRVLETDGLVSTAAFLARSASPDGFFGARARAKLFFPTRCSRQLHFSVTLSRLQSLPRLLPAFLHHSSTPDSLDAQVRGRVRGAAGAAKDGDGGRVCAPIGTPKCRVRAPRLRRPFFPAPRPQSAASCRAHQLGASRVGEGQAGRGSGARLGRQKTGARGRAPSKTAWVPRLRPHFLPAPRGGLVQVLRIPRQIAARHMLAGERSPSCAETCVGGKTDTSAMALAGGPQTTERRRRSHTCQLTDEETGRGGLRQGRGARSHDTRVRLAGLRARFSTQKTALPFARPLSFRSRPPPWLRRLLRRVFSVRFCVFDWGGRVPSPGSMAHAPPSQGSTRLLPLFHPYNHSAVLVALVAARATSLVHFSVGKGR